MSKIILLHEAEKAAEFLLAAAGRADRGAPLFACVGETHYFTYDMAFTLALIHLLQKAGKQVRLGLEHEHNALSRYFSASSRNVARLPKTARSFSGAMPEDHVRSLVAYSTLESENVLVYWALTNGVGIDCLDLMTRESKSTEDDEALDLSDDFTRASVKKFGRVPFKNCLGPAGIPGVPIRNAGMATKAMQAANTFKPDIYLIVTGLGHLAGYEGRPDSSALDSRLREAGCDTVSILIGPEASVSDGNKNSLWVQRGAGPSSDEFFRCISEEQYEDFRAAEGTALLEYFTGTDIPMAALLVAMKKDRERWAGDFNQMFRDRLAAFGL